MCQSFVSPVRTLYLFLGLFSVGLQLLNAPRAVRANAFDPPPEQNAPRSTAGGGSRPGTVACAVEDTNNPSASFLLSAEPQDDSRPTAIALSPQTFIGLSTEARPTLWLHLPAHSAQTLEISLFDEHRRGIAQAQLPITEQAGFVPIRLTPELSLSEGKIYYWAAALVCNTKRRIEDWVMGGWIRYQPLTNDERLTLQSLSPLQTINQYIETGYWYDALTGLLQLTPTASASNQIQSMWKTLLQQARLNTPWIDLDNALQASQQ